MSAFLYEDLPAWGQPGGRCYCATDQELIRKVYDAISEVEQNESMRRRQGSRMIRDALAEPTAGA